MAFIHNDFLLRSETARRLYHGYAENQPILDFHCHLPVSEIAENRRFRNLTEIGIEGDHYKWRAMRMNGVPERYCTGDADAYDKFLAWARTVPRTLRNPLYHWTHLELARYFGIFDLLDESSAPAIWEQTVRQLVNDDLSAQGILEKFHVATICTTEDPTASLEYHERIAQSPLRTQVLLTFRPDKALQVHDPKAFNEWTDRLEVSAKVEIRSLADFLEALRKRHDDFHQHGCRLSDHGLNACFPAVVSERQAKSYFGKLRQAKQVTPEEAAEFAGFLMLFFGRLDAEKGWAKQLHLGAFRNANARMLGPLGPDTGFDSIGDWAQAQPLAAYLDQLERENSLPKTILFNANPADNYLLATMAGNFPGEELAGKIQFGSGWWFLDQKEGIELQLNALSNCGLLSLFVGMVTDSRSFLSFTRHEYFRRVLCNLLGDEVEKGLLPNDEHLLGTVIQGVCFENAKSYLGLPGKRELKNSGDTSKGSEKLQARPGAP